MRRRRRYDSADSGRLRVVNEQLASAERKIANRDAVISELRKQIEDLQEENSILVQQNHSFQTSLEQCGLSVK